MLYFPYHSIILAKPFMESLKNKSDFVLFQKRYHTGTRTLVQCFSFKYFFFKCWHCRAVSPQIKCDIFYDWMQRRIEHLHKAMQGGVMFRDSWLDKCCGWFVYICQVDLISHQCNNSNSWKSWWGNKITAL